MRNCSYIPYLILYYLYVLYYVYYITVLKNGKFFFLKHEIWRTANWLSALLLS